MMNSPKTGADERAIEELNEADLEAASGGFSLGSIVGDVESVATHVFDAAICAGGEPPASPAPAGATPPVSLPGLAPGIELMAGKKST